MQDHQPWRAHGKCSTLLPEDADRLFYLGRGQSPKAAKEFCSDCPVRRPCLFFALFYGETGIWAGTTDKDRENLRGFLYEEVTFSMEVTFIESRNLADFLPPQEVSGFESAQSGWHDDERLVG